MGHDVVALEADAPHTRSCRDGEVVADETLSPQPGREDAGAVAAHLRERAVGIAVVHEPLGLVGLGADVGLGGVGRADDADDAVAADAGLPVGEADDLLGGEVEPAVEVGHDDEVVFGAVALGESQRHGVHCVGRRARSDATCTRSGAVASSHRGRGSGRHHDSCRRA